MHKKIIASTLMLMLEGQMNIKVAIHSFSWSVQIFFLLSISECFLANSSTFDFLFVDIFFASAQWNFSQTSHQAKTRTYWNTELKGNVSILDNLDGEFCKQIHVLSMRFWRFEKLTRKIYSTNYSQKIDKHLLGVK